MLNIIRRARVGAVAFCERCGEVCDRACRADAARDEAWKLVLAHPRPLA